MVTCSILALLGSTCLGQEVSIKSSKSLLWVGETLEFEIVARLPQRRDGDAADGLLILPWLEGTQHLSYISGGQPGDLKLPQSPQLSVAKSRAVNASSHLRINPTRMITASERRVYEYTHRVLFQVTQPGRIGPLAARLDSSSASGRSTVRSNSVTLQARELPRAGRPVFYTGGIGPYRLSLQLVQSIASPSEPRLLELVVGGSENLDAFQPPDLLRQQLWRQNYNARLVDDRIDREQQRRVFRYQVRARVAPTPRTPVIKSATFDPRSRRYQTLIVPAVSWDWLSESEVTALRHTARFGQGDLIAAERLLRPSRSPVWLVLVLAGLPVALAFVVSKFRYFPMKRRLRKVEHDLAGTVSLLLGRRVGELTPGEAAEVAEELGLDADAQTKLIGLIGEGERLRFSRDQDLARWHAGVGEMRARLGRTSRGDGGWTEPLGWLSCLVATLGFILFSWPIAPLDSAVARVKAATDGLVEALDESAVGSFQARRAASEFSDLVRDFPDQSGLWLHAGISFAAAGEMDWARRCLLQAGLTEPENSKIRSALLKLALPPPAAGGSVQRIAVLWISLAFISFVSAWLLFDSNLAASRWPLRGVAGRRRSLILVTCICLSIVCFVFLSAESHEQSAVTVATKRSVARSGPGETYPETDLLVGPGDGLRVEVERSPWLKVSLLGEDRTGWIREDCLLAKREAERGDLPK